MNTKRCMVALAAWMGLWITISAATPQGTQVRCARRDPAVWTCKVTGSAARSGAREARFVEQQDGITLFLFDGTGRRPDVPVASVEEIVRQARLSRAVWYEVPRATTIDGESIHLRMAP
jgi:hypothetical protein